MMKKQIIILKKLSYLGLLFLLGCSPEETVINVPVTTPVEPTPVLPNAPVSTYGVCNSDVINQTVRFIHVADLHGHFGFEEQYFSKIRKAYLNAKEENEFTLFTNGGDDYEKGTVAEQLSQGNAVSETIKAMKFDYRVIGNHDFAWGPEQLLMYARDDDGDDHTQNVLASNTTYVGDDPLGFSGVSFAIAEVGCINIGFLGLTSAPWNELDEEIELPADFIEDFAMRWDWSAQAQELIDGYGDQVDYIVLLSHLGIDTDVVEFSYVEGIDLVLGGHSHELPQYAHVINKDDGSFSTDVFLPDFNAKGYTDIEITFNTENKQVVSHNFGLYGEYNANNIGILEDDDTDQEVKDAIDKIMGEYAPDASTEIAIAYDFADSTKIMEVLHDASSHVDNSIDAALFDTEEVDGQSWSLGAMTQEDFHQMFPVERQTSNTPGFNSVYKVEVTGSELFNLKNNWIDRGEGDVEATINLVYSGLDIDSEEFRLNDTYTLALFKGAAFNPELFFETPPFTREDIEFVGESWYLLDSYARYRTGQCYFFDKEELLPGCDGYIDPVTVWQFNTSSALVSDGGDTAPAVLQLVDVDGAQLTDICTDEAIPVSCGTTQEFGISDLPDNEIGQVIRLDSLESKEATLELIHNSVEGTHFTLVFDAYWPSNSLKDNKYSALLSANTLDDAPELYLQLENNDGNDGQYATIGKTSAGGYYGEILPDTWHRIAFSFVISEINGHLYKLYIDGKLVHTAEANSQTVLANWTLDDSPIRLLTDTDNFSESSTVYLNALLFASRQLTTEEIESLATVSERLDYTLPSRELSATVERAYSAAPMDWSHKWLIQRNKFNFP